MIMNSNRLRTQMAFEQMYNGIESEQWQRLKKRNILDRKITSEEAERFKETLEGDSKDFYFKGLLSLIEALSNIKNGLYSWATVKLYYSTYYLLRCSLTSKEVAVVRHKRELFYIRCNENEKFKQPSMNQDHQAIIDISVKLFAEDDKLQSNLINDENSYEWLKDRREAVNYKSREFLEPVCPAFFTEISENIKNSGIELLVKRIIEDAYILTFQEEYAIIAIPLKRFLLTKETMLANGIDISLSKEKLEVLTKLLPKNTIQILTQ